MPAEISPGMPGLDDPRADNPLGAPRSILE